MFPLSTQNICWNSEGFAVHAQCGDGFYFVPSLFSRTRNRSLRQQLLELLGNLKIPFKGFLLPRSSVVGFSFLTRELVNFPC